MRVSGVLLIAAMPLFLAACGGSSSSSNGTDDEAGSDNGALGLDGTWGGIADDINLDMATISATIDGNSITRFEIDGVPAQPATITKLQSDVFEYLTNDGIYGGFMADPSKSYAVVVNELGDFAVVQKGASEPFGSASILDLEGAWTGSVIGFFGGTTYRYPTTGECNSGICVFTATGPAVDENGSVIEQVTGLQATWNLFHRASLAFDADVQNDRGFSGVGAGFLSKDKEFFGGYACPPSGTIDDCEFGALVKE